MHWTLVTTCCLVVWALAGGIWRPGSAALAASWMFGQLWYVLSGDSVPLGVYLLLDPLVVLAVVFWRASMLDWLIVAIFPLEWVIYFAMEGSEQWWLLFWCSSVQLLCAGPWPQLQKTLSSVSHGPLRQIGADK